jgi:NAD(P)-dependent dehydrogenase (short-subunit alcohol dehydrogenase family)
MPTQHWTSDDLPDLTGRTVVVTGASSGIGVTTASALAPAGAHVVLGVAPYPISYPSWARQRAACDVT